MSWTRFPHGISSFGMPVFGSGDVLTTGNIWFVDSDTTYGSDSNSGETPTDAFLTIDYAIGKCTANNGDIIIVKEGHAETVTTAITADIAGVTILGLGHGDKRPTITVNAAIPGLNVTAVDCKFHNLQFVAGSSITAATRILRVAANGAKFTGCQFSMPYDMYHMIVVFKGDEVEFVNCVFKNSVTTNASVHPQTGLLVIGAAAKTDVLIKNCRFEDVLAKKAERWRAVIEGSGQTAATSAHLGTQIRVEDCDFLCRGVAVAARSLATSNNQITTVDCRGISPSGNTAVASIFGAKYIHMIEAYNVAAVNKVGLVNATAA